MGFDFLEDLDEYFCEKYANYDSICILNGYNMPKMQTTERREDGSDYSYTLPANTMRLALQANRAELLKQLKEKMADPSFSFAFKPLGLFAQFKNKFSKTSFKKNFSSVLGKYNMTEETLGKQLDVDEKTWGRIVAGQYIPTKNLLFTIALTVGMSASDLEYLLALCGLEFDYSKVKDTVIAYLVSRNICNPEMIKAALTEYKIENLFLKI